MIQSRVNPTDLRKAASRVVGPTSPRASSSSATFATSPSAARPARATAPSRFFREPRRADRPTASSQATALVAPPPLRLARRDSSQHPSACSEPLYADNAILNGEARFVECSLHASGYVLRAPGIGTFEVALDGSIGECTIESGADPATVEVVRLGPVLVLSLALQGKFCLHASAVGFDGRAVAFLGASGTGKSTLAALLHARGLAPLVADDILPLGAAATVFPRFPQLKLSSAQQPWRGLPESLPLAGVYLLGSPAERGPDVTSERLQTRDALVALVSHTVATRLFGPDLLARHLDLVGELAETVPVRRLRYPRRFSVAAEVHRVVVSDLEGVHA